MYHALNCLFISNRLHDVLHSEKKLTLVFEYCDQDLKKYFDSCNGEIDQDIVKVSKVQGRYTYQACLYHPEMLSRNEHLD